MREMRRDLPEAGHREDMMDQKDRRALLIEMLLNERPGYTGVEMPKSEEERALLLRGLLNIRPAGSMPPDIQRIQDEYLQEEIRRRGITDAESLAEVRPGICLWRGDITTLRCDAIVNAANSGMTGCYVPNHRCIDNAIHTFAGTELRLACERVMRQQGRPEPTGQAKITPAFNLPCRYVLHTVGPIVGPSLTDRDRGLLASCYRSCLDIASENGLESVAFCCISTGEFHFPNEAAAEIAISTVTEFMKKQTSIRRVIFDVFSDRDLEIYRRLLE